MYLSISLDSTEFECFLHLMRAVSPIGWGIGWPVIWNSVPLHVEWRQYQHPHSNFSKRGNEVWFQTRISRNKDGQRNASNCHCHWSTLSSDFYVKNTFRLNWKQVHIKRRDGTVDKAQWLECCLLLQRTRAGFPAPTWRLLTMLLLFLGSCALYWCLWALYAYVANRNYQRHTMYMKYI